MYINIFLFQMNQLPLFKIRKTGFLFKNLQIMSILQKLRKTLHFQISENYTIYYGLDKIERSKIEIDFNVFLPTIRNKKTGQLGINLQREFCWTLEEKQELIISIIKGIKLPPLAIISYIDDSDRCNQKHVYKIIDGKQRLSTIISFINNEFPIIVEGIEFFYKDFDNITLNEFNKTPISGFMAVSYYDKPIPDKAIYDWFVMLNFAGKKVDKEHLENFDI